MEIREMTIEDYQDLIELLSTTPGITIREADSKESTKNYLNRNPGLSFIAIEGDRAIGCVMSGHDGRRGFIHHLVVIPEFREKGIGKALYMSCINSFKEMGIEKTHLFVLNDNDLGNSFWSKNNWKLRDDINMYSYNCSKNSNA